MNFCLKLISFTKLTIAMENRELTNLSCSIARVSPRWGLDSVKRMVRRVVKLSCVRGSLTELISTQVNWILLTGTNVVTEYGVNSTQYLWPTCGKLMHAAIYRLAEWFPHVYTWTPWEVHNFFLILQYQRCINNWGIPRHQSAYPLRPH